MSVKSVLLEQENEKLRNKVEVLERAVREIDELMKEAAGVYWYRKQSGLFHRPVGNLYLNTWNDISEYISNQQKAMLFLREEQQDN